MLIPMYSYYFLFWITTAEGKKYHFCIDPILFGNTTSGAFYSLNDLNDPSEFTSIGGSNMRPGYGSSEALNFRSVTHNVTSPRGSDNFSTVALDTDFAGVKVNLVTHPTGKNMYYGGMGGIVTPGFGDDFTTVPPGWAWYWVRTTSSLSSHLIFSFSTTLCRKEHRLSFNRQTHIYKSQELLL